MKKIMLFFLLTTVFLSCNHDVIQPKKINSYLAPPAINKSCLVPENVSYNDVVKPILDRNCYSCHDNSCSVPFTQYDELKYYAASGKLVELLHDHRTTPNELLDLCSVDLIKAWVQQGFKNN